MDGWEERTREPEDRTIEITESEKNNRDKQTKKNAKNRDWGIHEILTKDQTFMSLVSQKRRKKAGLKKHSKKSWLKTTQIWEET